MTRRARPQRTRILTIPRMVWSSNPNETSRGLLTRSTAVRCLGAARDSEPARANRQGCHPGRLARRESVLGTLNAQGIPTSVAVIHCHRHDRPHNGLSRLIGIRLGQRYALKLSISLDRRGCHNSLGQIDLVQDFCDGGLERHPHRMSKSCNVGPKPWGKIIDQRRKKDRARTRTVLGPILLLGVGGEGVRYKTVRSLGVL